MFTLKLDSFRYSSKQFGLWRMAFGLFLAFYNLRVFPYAIELYSRAGALPDIPQTLSYRNSFFPRFLLAMDTPEVAKAIVLGCILFSIMIAAGFKRRWAAFFHWLLVTWLFNRNPFVDSPDYGFVNWLIFALIFIPEGESFSLSRKDPQWEMPPSFYWAAWAVLSFGYLYAGSTKIKYGDPAWLNGSAMYYVLATDSSRVAWYGNIFDNLPLGFFVPLTWGVVVLQMASPLLVVFRSLRPWWWLAITAMQVGILALTNLTEVSLGMLLFHVFLWDQTWKDIFFGCEKRLRGKSAAPST